MADPRLDLAGLAPGATGEIVLATLDSFEVVIEAEELHTLTRSDQVALYNLTNQVCRLFGKVRVEVPGHATADLGVLGRGTLGETLASLVSDLSFPTSDCLIGAPARLHLAWGKEPSGDGFAGDASGWTFSVGPAHIPVATAATTAPALGSIAATSFMAAQALGVALSGLGVPFYRSRGFVANLLNYANDAAPVTDGEATLGELVLCGAGSVGSSVIYCAMLCGITGGPLDIVDGDFLKERNTFRYPILRGERTDPKADWVAASARRAGLNVTEKRGSIQQYIEGFAEVPALPLVAVSVDTVDGRRDATDLLARTTLNAGVHGLNLHLARHSFGDEGCAYCQYVDVEAPLSASAALAEQTGLSVERVVELEITGGLLNEEDIEAIAASGRLQGAPPEAGERLSDLRRRVYAQTRVPTAEGDVLVASPFVSTIAGLLILGEALKEADPALHAFRLDGRFDLDMSGEPGGFTSSIQRDSTHRCLCWSPHRRIAWNGLWASERSSTDESAQ